MDPPNPPLVLLGAGVDPPKPPLIMLDVGAGVDPPEPPLVVLGALADLPLLGGLVTSCGSGSPVGVVVVGPLALLLPPPAPSESSESVTRSITDSSESVTRSMVMMGGGSGPLEAMVRGSGLVAWVRSRSVGQVSRGSGRPSGSVVGERMRRGARTPRSTPEDFDCGGVEYSDDDCGGEYSTFKSILALLPKYADSPFLNKSVPKYAAKNRSPPPSERKKTRRT